MTREYFNVRYSHHCDTLKEYANAGKLADAQAYYARIIELLDIAEELEYITDIEFTELLKQAQDCFYCNL